MLRAFAPRNTLKIHEGANEMSNEKMAERLNSIGQYVAAILNDDPDDSYLYAEATNGSVEGGIF